jgi:hypothetical protein
LLSWKKNLENSNIGSFHEFSNYELNIQKINLNDYCDDIEAILINPPWSNNETNLFTFEHLKNIQFPFKKIKEGMIFIWIEKEFLYDTLKFFEKNNFGYVENLTWVKLDPNKVKTSIYIYFYLDLKSLSNDPFDIRDLFATDEYKYFTRSKLNLYLLRKVK